MRKTKRLLVCGAAAMMVLAGCSNNDTAATTAAETTAAAGESAGAESSAAETTVAEEDVPAGSVVLGEYIGIEYTPMDTTITRPDRSAARGAGGRLSGPYPGCDSRDSGGHGVRRAVPGRALATPGAGRRRTTWMI